MEISEVRVRVVEDANDRLKAVCTVTFDDEFVVRDVKIVEGSNGLFVAMPSRKLTTGCLRCRNQNHLRARHCNECGSKLPEARIPADENGREKAHRDIAHPITAGFRQALQDQVLEAYRIEAEEAGDAGPADRRPVEDRKRRRPEPKPELDDEIDDEVDEEIDEDIEDEIDAEPEDAIEFDEPKKGKRTLSDYDALIAHLKGGPKRDAGDDRNGSRGGGAARPQDRGEERPRRGGRGGRGRGGRRDDRDKPASSEAAPPAKSATREAASEAKPAPRREPPVAPAPAPQRVEKAPPAPVLNQSGDGGFGAGVFETPKKKTAPKPAPAVAKSEPPAAVSEPKPVADVKPEAPTYDDNEGFGAGLL